MITLEKIRNIVQREQRKRAIKLGLEFIRDENMSEAIYELTLAGNSPETIASEKRLSLIYSTLPCLAVEGIRNVLYGHDGSLGIEKYRGILEIEHSVKV